MKMKASPLTAKVSYLLVVLHNDRKQKMQVEKDELKLRW